MRNRFAALALVGGAVAALAAPSLAFAADYPDDDGYRQDSRYEDRAREREYEPERVERRRVVVEEPVEERIVVRRRYVAPPVVVVGPRFYGRPRYGFYGRPYGHRRFAYRGRW